MSALIDKSVSNTHYNPYTRGMTALVVAAYNGINDMNNEAALIKKEKQFSCKTNMIKPVIEVNVMRTVGIKNS